MVAPVTQCSILIGILLVFFQNFNHMDCWTPSLEDCFQDIMNLMPWITLRKLAIYHYKNDESFRKAADYTRGSAFPNLWRKLMNTPEVGDLMEFAFSEINLPSDIYVKSISYGVPKTTRRWIVNSDLSKNETSFFRSRSVGDFLTDAVNSLSRQHIQKWLIATVYEGGDFSKLYMVLRSREFKTMLTEVLASPNLAPYLKELSTNGLNIEDFVDAFNRVLGWGPRIARPIGRKPSYRRRNNTHQKS